MSEMVGAHISTRPANGKDIGRKAIVIMSRFSKISTALDRTTPPYIACLVNEKLLAWLYVGAQQTT